MRRHLITTFIILSLLLVLCSGCSQKADKLRIGIISPSINHFPLSFSYQTNLINPSHVQMYEFASGWEAQEAMAAGKLDMAVLPFTYAWTLRSKGYKVKTIACLERETDGIVMAGKDRNTNSLQSARIGLLRASSIEALMDDYAQRQKITYEKVFFRTPTELVEALKSGQVKAVVSYVPTIQKLTDDYTVYHWFSDTYPAHPCCNLVATEDAIAKKFTLVEEVTTAIRKSLEFFVSHPVEAIKAIEQDYHLTPVQADSAYAHVKFSNEITPEDKAFERRMMELFLQKGYISSMPSVSEMYR